MPAPLPIWGASLACFFALDDGLSHALQLRRAVCGGAPIFLREGIAMSVQTTKRETYLFAARDSARRQRHGQVEASSRDHAIEKLNRSGLLDIKVSISPCAVTGEDETAEPVEVAKEEAELGRPQFSLSNKPYSGLLIAFCFPAILVLVIVVLASISDSSDEIDNDRLLAAKQKIQDIDPQERIMGIGELVEIVKSYDTDNGLRQALEILIGMTDDQDEDVRKIVLEAISDYHFGIGLSLIDSEPSIDLCLRLLRIQKSDISDSLDVAGYRGLASIGVRSPEAEKIIISRIKQRLRQKITEPSGSLVVREMMREMVDLELMVKTIYLRESTYALIGMQYDDKNEISLIIELLYFRDSTGEIRENAAEILGNIGSNIDEILVALHKAMKEDSELSVRSAAAKALKKIEAWK